MSPHNGCKFITALGRANKEIKNAAGEFFTLILPLLKMLTVVLQKAIE